MTEDYLPSQDYSPDLTFLLFLSTIFQIRIWPKRSQGRQKKKSPFTEGSLLTFSLLLICCCKTLPIYNNVCCGQYRRYDNEIRVNSPCTHPSSTHHENVTKKETVFLGTLPTRY